MSPRLQMMVAFAAASLQGRLAAGHDPQGISGLACWRDAQELMDDIPPSVRAELETSRRAFNNNGNPYPDNG